MNNSSSADKESNPIILPAAINIAPTKEGGVVSSSVDSLLGQMEDVKCSF